MHPIDPTPPTNQELPRKKEAEDNSKKNEAEESDFGIPEVASGMSQGAAAGNNFAKGMGLAPSAGVAAAAKLAKIAVDIAKDKNEEDIVARVTCNIVGTTAKIVMTGIAVSRGVLEGVNSVPITSHPYVKGAAGLSGGLVASYYANKVVEPVTEEVTQKCKDMFHTLDKVLSRPSPGLDEWKKDMAEPDFLNLSHENAAEVGNAILGGFSTALLQTAHVVANPMETIFEPLGDLVWHAGVLASLPKDNPSYTESLKYMTAGWNGLRSGFKNFKNADFPEQLKTVVEVVSSTVMGAGVGAATAKAAQASANVLRFGSTVSPSAFLASEVFTNPTNSINNISASGARAMENRKFSFGVSERGELVISKGFSVQTNNRTLHLSFMNTSEKIVAAGEFVTGEAGSIRNLELFMGQGNMTATRATDFIENIFVRDGFKEVRGKAAVFTEAKSFNQYQPPPNPAANNNFQQVFKKRTAATSSNVHRFPEQLPKTRPNPARFNESVRNPANMNHPPNPAPPRPPAPASAAAAGVGATAAAGDNIAQSIRTNRNPMESLAQELNRNSAASHAASTTNTFNALNSQGFPSVFSSYAARDPVQEGNRIYRSVFNWNREFNSTPNHASYVRPAPAANQAASVAATPSNPTQAPFPFASFMSSYMVNNLQNSMRFSEPVTQGVPSTPLPKKMFDPYTPYFNYSILSNEDHLLVQSLEREMNRRFPRAMNAYQWAKDRGFKGGYSEFCNKIRDQGLMPSFSKFGKFSNLRDMREFIYDIMGVLADVGGIDGKIGQIPALLNNPHAFTTNDYRVIFPYVVDERMLQKINHIKRELDVAYFEHGALPIISYSFNQEHALYPTIHPSFQKTHVGAVLGLLDYWLKLYLVGSGCIDVNFIENWSGNRDEGYLLQHSTPLKEYWREQQLPGEYYSFFEFLERANLGDDSLGEFSQKYGQRFMSSFRIIAKQKHIEWSAEHNAILCSPSFEVEYTIDLYPHYQEYINQYKKEHGKMPDDYNKIVQCHIDYCREIKQKMPLLPFCKEYFELLGAINLFGYLNCTFAALGKRPNYPELSSDACVPVVVPNVSPPHPLEIFTKYPLSFTVKSILLLAQALQPVTFEKQLNTYIINPDIPNVAAIISILQELILESVKKQLPGTITQSERFHFEESNQSMVAKHLAASLIDIILEHKTRLTQLFNELILSINPAYKHDSNWLRLINDLDSLLKSETSLAITALATLPSKVIAYPKLPHQAYIAMLTLLERDLKVSLDAFQKARAPESFSTALKAEFEAFKTGSNKPVDSPTNISQAFDVRYNALVNSILKPYKNQLLNLQQQVARDQNFLNTLSSLEIHEPPIQLTYLDITYGFKKPGTSINVYGGCGIDLSEPTVIPIQHSKLLENLNHYFRINNNSDVLDSVVGDENGIYSVMDLEVDGIDVVANKALTSAQHKSMAVIHYVDAYNALPRELTTAQTLVALDSNEMCLAHYAAALFPDSVYAVFLMRFPGSIHVKDKQGQLPIHHALMSSDLDRVKTLLARDRSQLEAPTFTGRTLLWIAVETGQLDLVEALIQEGANPNIAMADNANMLNRAIQQNFPEIALRLIAAGAATNTYGHTQQSSLHYAISFKMEQVALAIIQKGVNLTLARRSDGYEAWHFAIRLALTPVIAALRPVVNVNSLLDNKSSVLHIAAKYQPQLVSSLLAYVDADLANNDGDTALVVAIKAGHKKAAMTLARLVVPTLKLKNDGYLIELAYRYGMPDISEFLFKRLEEALKDSAKKETMVERYPKIVKAYFYQILSHGDLIRFEQLTKQFPPIIALKYKGKTTAEVAAEGLHFHLYYAIKEQALTLKLDLKSSSGALVRKNAFRAVEPLWETLRGKYDPTKPGIHYHKMNKYVNLVQMGSIEGFKKIGLCKFYGVSYDYLRVAIQYHQQAMLEFLINDYSSDNLNELSKLIMFAVRYNNKVALGYLLRLNLDLSTVFFPPYNFYDVHTPFDMAIAQSNHSMLKTLFKKVPKAFWPAHTLSATNEIKNPLVKAVWLKYFKGMPLVEEKKESVHGFYKTLELIKLLEARDYQQVMYHLTTTDQSKSQHSCFYTSTLETREGYQQVKNMIKGLAECLMTKQLKQLELIRKIIEVYTKRFAHLQFPIIGENLIHYILKKFSDEIACQLIQECHPLMVYISGDKHVLTTFIEDNSCGIDMFQVAVLKNYPLSATLLSNLYQKHTRLSTRKTTLLHRAIEGSSPMINELISIIPINSENIHGHTPLMIAVMRKDKITVHKLLEAGANIHCFDYQGFNLLHHAIFAKNTALFMYLIEKGVNPWHASHKGDTPLHLAAQEGLLAIVRYLCSAGGGESWVNKNGYNALHIAALNNRGQIIHFLVKHGFDVNKPAECSKKNNTTKGCTPVHLATLKGHVYNVNRLLDLGATLTACDAQQLTIFDYAVRSGSLDMLRYVQNYIQYVDRAFNGKMLFAAARYNNSVALGELLANSIAVSECNEQGQTVLQIAIWSRSVDVAVMLIKQFDCLIDHQDEKGNTALHYAIYQNQGRLLDLLLSNEANASIPTQSGQTPLTLACKLGHLQLVTILIQHGVDVHLANKHDKTPRDVALEEEHPEIVTLLDFIIEQEPEPSIKNNPSKLSEAIHIPLSITKPLPIKVMTKPTVATGTPLTPIKGRIPQLTMEKLLDIADFNQLKKLSLTWFYYQVADGTLVQMKLSKDTELETTPLTKDSITEKQANFNSFLQHVSVSRNLHPSDKILIVQLYLRSLQFGYPAAETASQFCQIAERLRKKFGAFVFYSLAKQAQNMQRSASTPIEHFINSSLAHLESKKIQNIQYSWWKPAINASLTPCILSPLTDEIINRFRQKTEDDEVQFPLGESELLNLTEFTKKLYAELNLIAKQAYLPINKSSQVSYKTMAIAITMYSRKIGFYPHPTQIMVLAAFIHCPKQVKGLIAQVKTGEGKSTILAIISATGALLYGDKIDIITTTSPERDAVKFKPYFESLGLTVAAVSDKSPDRFNADILYGLNSEFEFAYLRHGIGSNDDLLMESGKVRQPKRAFLDEIDGLLIDMAQNSARIATASPVSRTWLYLSIYHYINLYPVVNINECLVYITKCATPHQRRQLRRMSKEQFDLKELLKNACYARDSLHVNVDYLVQEDEIIIIDKTHTGRRQEGCQWPKYHAFLQAKHGIKLSEETLINASVSHPAFFNRYEHLYGVTGTLGGKDERETLLKSYNIGSFDVPRYKPNLCTSLPYKFCSPENHHTTLLAAIHAAQALGRPSVFFFFTVETSKAFSDFLEEKKVTHRLHNGVFAQDEEFIVNQAGKSGSVTVVTNTAGRGTDFILDKKSLEAGGMEVYFTFYPANMRVKWQGFGRAGRQGQPGSCSMILSMDDPLIKELVSLLKNNPSSMLEYNALLLGTSIQMTMESPRFVELLDKLSAEKEVRYSQARLIQAANEAVYFQYMERFFAQIEKTKTLLADPNYLKLAFNQWLEGPPEINTELAQKLSDHDLGEKIKNVLENFPDSEHAWTQLSVQFKTAFLTIVLDQWAHIYTKLNELETIESIKSYYTQNTSKADCLIGNPEEKLTLFFNTLLSVNCVKEEVEESSWRFF